MREERKINRNLIIGAVVAVVVIVGLVAGVMALGNKEEGESAAPSRATPPASSENPTGDSSENVPGALVGNTQRTWPDPQGKFDDSPHATPGQYSIDPWMNRPVWTPRNHDGDLPKADKLSSKPGRCSEVKGGLSGKIQQQYVNARYLAVSERSGPSEMDKGVPGKYARDAEGAVLAAINQVGYGLYAQGDGIGEEIDKKLWPTSKLVQKEREFYKRGDKDSFAKVRALSIPAPAGYRIKQCSNDVVVVEIAMATLQPEYDPGMFKYTVGRVPMYWRDGDWKADFSGNADLKPQPTMVKDLEGFTEVEYT